MSHLIIPRHLAERPAIDLRIRLFERRKHGILIIGTWMHDATDPSEPDQPCLVLLHGGRDVRAGATVPVIIPLSQAWMWAAHGDVGDPVHCGRQVAEWLADGILPGNVHSPKDRLKVLDAINEALPDLLKMPPPPMDFGPRRRVSFGEMSIIDAATGRVLDQREVANHV